MKHCKTCKFFKGGIYPYNKQLGHCTNLIITMGNKEIPPVIGQFMLHGSLTPPETRVMNDFGCVWHQPKKQK